MEFLFGLIALPWFLMALILGFIGIGTCVCVGRQKFGWATFWALTTVVGLHVFGAVNILSFISENWEKLLIGGGIYLVVGFPWARWVKWPFFLSDRQKEELESVPEARRHWMEQKRYALQRHDDREIKFNEADYEAEWLKERDQRIADGRLLRKINVRNYKGKILGWMAFWPLSVLATVFGDLFARFWEKVLDITIRSFQKGADKSHEKLLEEFKKQN